MNSTIPIFPLNLVMYPGAVYPLHIFEERYKKLIHWCKSNDTGFGIVSKIDTTISTIGCYVEVIEVINIFENGSMDILIRSRERFQTVSTNLHEHGYITANVVPYLDDVQYIQPTALEGETVSKFKGILERTEIQFDNKYWTNFDRSTFKSFKIAEKSGMNLKQQQSLLSLRSESDRLKFLFEHFRKLEEYLDRTEVLKDIISGDGYIN
ncbi:MAG: hypothetical protein C4543_09965 [Ignavibacteriales bacterium]|jgi:Lon protease-like protein|nr:MAG: hypothetical protein C4543_09965 [Ignavibacteriales bacterium]